MAGYVLGVGDVLTSLGLVASLVAAASVMRRAHRAATERSPSLALEAAFGAAATLISATLFFNHQPQRQIRHAAPPWTANDDSREPNARAAEELAPGVKRAANHLSACERAEGSVRKRLAIQRRRESKAGAAELMHRGRLA